MVYTHIPYAGIVASVTMTKKKTHLVVRIDERGRTTIPKEMLKLLGIQPGGIMVFSREDDGPFYVGRGELKIDIPFLQKEKGRKQRT